MQKRALVLATITVAGLACPLAATTQAAERGAPRALGYVTAESNYGGTQRVSGPVRRNSLGRLEVRLPGGTWIECGRSCSDTLRRQTVDFWRNFPAGARSAGGVDGPGYLQLRR